MPILINLQAWLQKFSQASKDAAVSASKAEQSAQAAATSAGNAAAIVTGGTASLAPAAGKIPLADAKGVIDLNWLGTDTATLIKMSSTRLNDIGTPGELGFGVGICPSIPDGFSALPGTFILGSDDYGNYTYQDGSVCVWIPAHWCRIGHKDNPTYGQYDVNSVDIRPWSAFASEADANASGYFLPRAFVDGGAVRPGFMMDKYLCSNHAGIASSLKNGLPLSTAATHNPLSGLNGSLTNSYGACWGAAKTRGSQWFVSSRFIYVVLAWLSFAHAQRAGGTSHCAWYSATGNFPKGCNNSALGDASDREIVYAPDGYGNCGRTGSGTPFAKTTHNGQGSGVADLNGLMWEVSQGMTSVASILKISEITQSSPVSVTVTAHGLTTGQAVKILGVQGMFQLNDRIFQITVIDADHFSLDGVDGSTFGSYTTGGTVTVGQFFIAKRSVAMADLTGGSTLNTDHFGANGVATNMEAFVPVFCTQYPQNGYSQRFGAGSTPVFSADVEKTNAAQCRALGIPAAMSGLSASGTAAFGNDLFYQWIQDALCLRSGGYWLSGTDAGVWTLAEYADLNSSYDHTGFRCACYPL